MHSHTTAWIPAKTISSVPSERAGYCMMTDSCFPIQTYLTLFGLKTDPGVQVRRQRFFHPAIISSLGKIFFSRAHGEYSMKYGSNGRRMLDQMAPGAIAWICVAVFQFSARVNGYRSDGLCWDIEQTGHTITRERFAHLIENCNMTLEHISGHRVN